MKFFDRLRLAGKPSQEILNSKLESSPQNAIIHLDDFISHRTYQTLSKHIPSGRDSYDYEWLVNPFQFTRQTIQRNDNNLLFEFAEYLSTSTLWQDVAPHYFNSSAWTRVLKPMLESCPEVRRQELAEVLNRNGLLHRCFERLGYSVDVTKREWGIIVH